MAHTAEISLFGPLLTFVKNRNTRSMVEKNRNTRSLVETRFNRFKIMD